MSHLDITNSTSHLKSRTQRVIEYRALVMDVSRWPIHPLRSASEVCEVSSYIRCDQMSSDELDARTPSAVG